MENHRMTRRWIVQGGLLGLLALPLASVTAFGCSDVPTYDSLCGWVSDENNCYREFFRDVETRCGSLAPAKVGAFLSREALDLCVLAEGGQVLFEPPIELDKLPPETVGFKFINIDGTECGSALFNAKFDFSLTVKGDTPPDSGPVPDDLVTGGTFSMLGGASSETLNVTCPTGTELTFSRPELSRCREYEGIMPAAELDLNPGGIDQNGVVGFRIYFPPPEGSLDDASPIPVEYFQCIIPAAPPMCRNGVRDALETDVDCGGPTCNGCADSQLCVTPGDCLSGICEIKGGIRTCTGP
jgi:hypothetical protein